MSTTEETSKQTSISVTESAPVIRKIELVKNGRKGIKVTYATQESRNGIISPNEYKKKQDRPVQKELRDLFLSLRKTLLLCSDIKGHDGKQYKILEGNTSVHSIMFSDAGQFKLWGKRNVIDGVYEKKEETPLVLIEDVDSEESPLTDLFHNIKTETELFMKGIKGADTRQVVVDYLITKKDVVNPEEAFDTMSEEERQAIIKEALDDSGLHLVEENGELVIGFKEESEDNDPDLPIAIDNMVPETEEIPAIQYAKDANDIPDFDANL